MTTLIVPGLWYRQILFVLLYLSSRQEFARNKHCFSCQPYEKILKGEAEYVGTGGYGQDIYIVQKLFIYYKIMKIVKDSGFNGYIGIEYEGDKLSEEEGIRKTKALLEKVRMDLV